MYEKMYAVKLKDFNIMEKWTFWILCLAIVFEINWLNCHTEIFDHFFHIFQTETLTIFSCDIIVEDYKRIVSWAPNRFVNKQHTTVEGPMKNIKTFRLFICTK